MTRYKLSGKPFATVVQDPVQTGLEFTFVRRLALRLSVPTAHRLLRKKGPRRPGR